MWIKLINFNIESINIPDEELKKIQEIYYKTLEAKELSKTVTGGAYAQIKSFEIRCLKVQNIRFFVIYHGIHQDLWNFQW